MNKSVSVFDAAVDLDAAGLKGPALEAWRYEAHRLGEVADKLEGEKYDLQQALQRTQEELLSMEFMLEREKEFFRILADAKRQSDDLFSKTLVERNRALWDLREQKELAEKREKQLAFREADKRKLEALGRMLRHIGASYFFGALCSSGAPKPEAHEINAIMGATGWTAGTCINARNAETW